MKRPWSVNETGLIPPTPPTAEDAEMERLEIASLQGPTPEEFDEHVQDVCEDVTADQEPPQAAACRTFRRVYTVTFASGAEGRAQPGAFTREEYAVLLHTRHSEQFSTNKTPSAACPVNLVRKIMVFKELHSDGNVHLYAIIQCDRPYGYQLISKALQRQDNVYVSFGSHHVYFWTAVVYASVPSEHKAPAEIDTVPYHSDGRTTREELSDIPPGARKCDRDRVLAHLGLPSKSSTVKMKATCTKEVLAERIIAEQWHSSDEISRAAASSKVADPQLYATVLRTGKQKLEEFVTRVWSMEPCPPVVSISRLDKLHAALLTLQCTCGGRWTPAASYLMSLQGLEPRHVPDLILRALRLGRRKDVNILITGVPDAGKSFVFRPLPLIFRAFETRGQRERFPLQGLPGADICVLQDARYESMGLPWDDWLRWGDGETLMINVPRNVAAASLVYTESAPLFATMTDVFRFPPQEARASGRDVERENIQFRSRWRIIHFKDSIPADRRSVDLDACGLCAAKWYIGVD